MPRGPRCYQWRAFDRETGRIIERQLRAGGAPVCPRCREPLEARPSSRLGRCIVLDATGYDLDCRGCRRFWCVVRHTQRSRRLLRMRRLVAAVRATASEPPRVGTQRTQLAAAG